MTAPIGTAGTAGPNYRVPEKAGRHRAPPTPPRPDRFVVPIAAAAAVLTLASFIAIAQAVAPDATAATDRGVTVTTAARTSRTVHVPLTILPAPVPTIGASGAWDPETDARIPVSTRSEAAGASGTTPGVPRSPEPAPDDGRQALTATAEPTQTTVPTQSAGTTTAQATTTSASETTEATTEPTVTTEPTATETTSEPLPTDLPIPTDPGLGDE